MGFLTKFKELMFNFIPGPYWGLIAVSLALVGYFISYLLYPAYLYNIMHFGSELALGGGGIFFSLGITISGVLFFIFYLYLDDVFKRENTGPKLRKLAFLLTMISTITYTLLGIFPGDPSNIVIFYMHGTLVVFCYSSAVGYLCCYSLIYLKNPKFSNFVAYSGFIIAGMMAIFLFVWIPPLQWTFTIMFFIWFYYIPINLLIKKL